MATFPSGDAGVSLCAHSTNQEPAFESCDSVHHYFQQFNNGDRRMDPSILNEVSLWYQDAEVSKLFYLLLKACGHLLKLYIT